MSGRPAIDLTGKRFGRWTVLGRIAAAPGRTPIWNARCDCGTEAALPSDSLRYGRSQSCGCAKAAAQAKWACPRCGETKPVGVFPLRGSRRMYCAPCVDAREAERAAVTDGSRRCCRCKEVKPLEEFQTLRTHPSGRGWHCVPCMKAKFHETVAAIGREGVSARAKASRERARTTALAHYGNRCACCGETETRFLAFDHIDGGGNAHRRADPKAAFPPRWLIRNGFPAGFRVLCHNCNMARGIYGYCPHEREQAAAS